jgi:hypothetical protein
MHKFECTECGSKLKFETDATYIKGEINFRGNILLISVDSPACRINLGVSCSQYPGHKIPMYLVRRVNDYFYKIMNQSVTIKRKEK